jgi:hypothetical protein
MTASAAELFEAEQRDGWAETAATIDQNARQAARTAWGCFHPDTAPARRVCGVCAAEHENED